MISSGQVSKKDRIRASMEKLSGRVWKNCPGEYGKTVRASTGSALNKCESEKSLNSGEYRKKAVSVSVSKNCRASTEKASNKCEDRKMISSGEVPKKDRIRASMEKLSGRVLEMRRISVSTEK